MPHWGLANESETSIANAFTSSCGFLKISQNSNATIWMGNRNEDSDDDEGGVTPTKHSRRDVISKFRDNNRKFLLIRQLAAQRNQYS